MSDTDLDSARSKKNQRMILLNTMLLLQVVILVPFWAVTFRQQWDQKPKCSSHTINQVMSFQASVNSIRKESTYNLKI
jgi:hypothetical protein